ncbi:glycosyltransferase [Streptomyces sp. AJS327]|uniref:glycosyltransferase n=1 Tax=Streptomyces sp. AJS327 TaxID=2545265 RepID=UPI0015DEDBCD|nr:glycosyltransferase [Streptomyces sp. AJS327]MBA0052916.1 glycosyltransferase [Streptomyces sp. AJS327]
MSRFLFVMPPFVGHINPAVAVARALGQRDHETAWVGFPDPLRGMLPPGATLFPVQRSEPHAVPPQRPGTQRGFAALRSLWQDALIPLAETMVPTVEEAVERFRPTVLVADQQALAGAVVGRRRGLTWATSASSSAELTNSVHQLPRVDGWIRGLLTELQQRGGIADADTHRSDLRFSEHLTLVYSVPELVGRGDFPPHYALVGPAITPRPPVSDFPWHRLDAHRSRVLVSLGTLSGSAGTRFLRTIARVSELLAERVQFIVADPAGALPGPPRGLLTAPFLPQLELLERVDAVLCHAGHNTVCETLAAGLPLVVAPIRDDQPVVAEQVVAAGAALRVPFARATPDAVATAVSAVLDDPSFRQAASGIQQAFHSAGGASAAAQHLERLL